jgi:hypothetical protein
MVSQRYAGLAYQRHCLTEPAASACIFGRAFAAMSVIQGAALTPRLLGTNIGFLYAYSAVQCPMEAVSGRRSAVHNMLAAGGMGAVGVSTGQLGIPLLDHSFFYRYPQIKPVQAGFCVYGLVGLAFGVLSGKTL